jgi:hypothetical protein
MTNATVQPIAAYIYNGCKDADFQIQAWLEPDTTEFEYKYQLFTFWDSLAEHQRTAALIKELLLAGINVDGLLRSNNEIQKT